MWTVIDEQAGLFTYERKEDGVSVLRATAVRLVDGSLCVVSPIVKTPEADHDWLREAGGVSMLLAPNHFHNLGLRSFVKRHDAVAVAVSPRVTKVTGVETSAIEALRERLPQHVRLMAVPGTKTGEVWLSVATERGPAWVVGDAFVHFPRTPMSRFGALAWCLGLSPGLKASPTFKWIALADRPGFVGWAREQLSSDAPGVLVPAHGEILSGPGLAGQLEAALEQRF